MGLVANVIEDLGVPTICVSLIPPLTRHTGAPRVVGLAHPMGLPLGLPHHVEQQRKVLQATLEAGAAISEPRSYIELPFEWPERRSQAIREPNRPPPIVQLLTSKPWLLPRLISGHLPDPPS